VNHNI